MKTSNKLLVMASVILLAYLIFYDLGLKAEYSKGTFKSRFYHMQHLNFKDFSTIKHNVANQFGIAIEKGPYGVWVADEYADRLNITQKARTLQIDRNDKQQHGYREVAIIVFCPSLDSLVTTAYAADSAYFNRFFYSGESTTIKGFEQPTMKIEESTYTQIFLNKNKLDQLDARINGKTQLTVNPNNQIKSASFDVKGKSHLTLNDLAIGNINYNLGDSAQVSLTGKAAQVLSNK